jgi:hypothetical protein
MDISGPSHESKGIYGSNRHVLSCFVLSRLLNFPVSKTGCRRFEPCHSCQKIKDLGEDPVPGRDRGDQQDDKFGRVTSPRGCVFVEAAILRCRLLFIPPLSNERSPKIVASRRQGARRFPISVRPLATNLTLRAPRRRRPVRRRNSIAPASTLASDSNLRRPMTSAAGREGRVKSGAYSQRWRLIIDQIGARASYARHQMRIPLRNRSARTELRSKTTDYNYDWGFHRRHDANLTRRLRGSEGERRHGATSAADKARIRGDLPVSPSRSIWSESHRSCRDRAIFRPEGLDMANGASRPRRFQALCERGDRRGPDIPREFRPEDDIGPRLNMVLKNEHPPVHPWRAPRVGVSLRG